MREAESDIINHLRLLEGQQGPVIAARRNEPFLALGTIPPIPPIIPSHHTTSPTPQKSRFPCPLFPETLLSLVQCKSESTIFSETFVLCQWLGTQQQCSGA